MARLKPVPKMILIAAVVGGLGYGVNVAIDKGIFHKDPAVATPVVVEQAPALVQPAVAPVPQPVQESAPADNAGLAKLLQAGKK